MKTVTFTEFRKNASEFFTDVEHGEVFLILRHGTPIAEVSPVTSSVSLPSWKQPALRMSAKGVSVSAAIQKERADEDVL